LRPQASTFEEPPHAGADRGEAGRPPRRWAVGPDESAADPSRSRRTPRRAPACGSGRSG
jgi:hypothetical protein